MKQLKEIGKWGVVVAVLFLAPLLAGIWVAFVILRLLLRGTYSMIWQRGRAERR